MTPSMTVSNCKEITCKTLASWKCSIQFEVLYGDNRDEMDKLDEEDGGGGQGEYNVTHFEDTVMSDLGHNIR